MVYELAGPVTAGTATGACPFEMTTVTVEP